MYEKSGKFYADWRTSDGVRHRKTFTTSKGALRHEVEQKRLNPTRGERSEANSRRFSSRPGGAPKATAGDSQPGRSSASREALPSPISALLMSTTPKKRISRGPASLADKPTIASALSSNPSTASELQTSPASSSSLPPKVRARLGQLRPN